MLTCSILRNSSKTCPLLCRRSRWTPRTCSLGYRVKKEECEGLPFTLLCVEEALIKSTCADCRPFLRLAGQIGSLPAACRAETSHPPAGKAAGILADFKVFRNPRKITDSAGERRSKRNGAKPARKGGIHAERFVPATARRKIERQDVRGDLISDSFIDSL